MSKLDSVLDEAAQLLANRQPGVIDTSSHTSINRLINLLNQYKELYLQGIKKIEGPLTELLGAKAEDQRLANIIGGTTGAAVPLPTTTTMAQRLRQLDSAKTAEAAAMTPAAAAITPAAAMTPATTSSVGPATFIPSKPLAELSLPSIFGSTARPLNNSQNGLPARPQLITISSTISLSAIVVTSFDAVKQDGYLYYNSNAEHFAFRLNGCLFHGNIGTIFDKPGDASRTADCRYADCRHREDGTCRYYHNPDIYSGSKERRNYVNSLTYTPASAPRGRWIHFGSLPNLDADAPHVDVGSANMMRDHSMHNLLCALIALDRASLRSHGSA